jgi:hypothetical protein
LRKLPHKICVELDDKFYAQCADVAGAEGNIPTMIHFLLKEYVFKIEDRRAKRDEGVSGEKGNDSKGD